MKVLDAFLNRHTQTPEEARRQRLIEVLQPHTNAPLVLADLILGMEVEHEEAIGLADKDALIEGAMEVIERYGGIDGDHHKMWVIDQVARALKGPLHYKSWVVKMKNGVDGPNTYDWDVGIAP